jgi:hypothetical protein
MKRVILLTVLSILCGVAHAGEALLSWVPPTERVDGTALTSLAGYRLLWGTAPRSYSEQVTVNDPGTTSYRITGLAPGTWYFAATAFDATGLESEYSAEVSKVIADAQPLPPDAVRVVQDAARTAYVIVQTADRITLVPVGAVPAGTACGSQAIRDANGVTAYVVPRSAVTWAGSVRSEVVVAECG